MLDLEARVVSWACRTDRSSPRTCARPRSRRGTSPPRRSRSRRACGGRRRLLVSRSIFALPRPDRRARPSRAALRRQERAEQDAALVVLRGRCAGARRRARTRTRASPSRPRARRRRTPWCRSRARCARRCPRSLRLPVAEGAPRRGLRGDRWAADVDAEAGDGRRAVGDLAARAGDDDAPRSATEQRDRERRRAEDRPEAAAASRRRRRRAARRSPPQAGRDASTAVSSSAKRVRRIRRAACCRWRAGAKGWTTRATRARRGSVRGRVARRDRR